MVEFERFTSDDSKQKMVKNTFVVIRSIILIDPALEKYI